MSVFEGRPTVDEAKSIANFSLERTEDIAEGHISVKAEEWDEDWPWSRWYSRRTSMEDSPRPLFWKRVWSSRDFGSVLPMDRLLGGWSPEMKALRVVNSKGFQQF